MAARNPPCMRLYVEKRTIYGSFILCRIHPAVAGSHCGYPLNGCRSAGTGPVSIQVPYGDSHDEHAHEFFILVFQTQQSLAVWHFILCFLFKCAAVATTFGSCHVLALGVGNQGHRCRCGCQKQKSFWPEAAGDGEISTATVYWAHTGSIRGQGDRQAQHAGCACLLYTSRCV